LVPMLVPVIVRDWDESVGEPATSARGRASLPSWRPDAAEGGSSLATRRLEATPTSPALRRRA